jgi:hypothetical protein
MNRHCVLLPVHLSFKIADSTIQSNKTFRKETDASLLRPAAESAEKRHNARRIPQNVARCSRKEARRISRENMGSAADNPEGACWQLSSSAINADSKENTLC